MAVGKSALTIIGTNESHETQKKWFYPPIWIWPGELGLPVLIQQPGRGGGYDADYEKSTRQGA